MTVEITRRGMVYVADDLSRVVFEDVESGEVVGEIVLQHARPSAAIRIVDESTGRVTAQVAPGTCYGVQYATPRGEGGSLRAYWQTLREVQL